MPLAPSPHMQEFAGRLLLCLLAGGCSLWLQVPICGSKSTTTRQGWQSKLLVPTLRLMIKSGVRGRFLTRSSWSAIDSQSSHKEGNPSSTYPRIRFYIYITCKVWIAKSVTVKMKPFAVIYKQKIEIIPLLSARLFQGVQHMISMKKLRLSGYQGTKARCDKGPPGDGTLIYTKWKWRVLIFSLVTVTVKALLS